jgi:putative DNA primase/helicase
MNAASIAHALGGEVSGRDAILAPGPGHSRRDRSLSIKIDPAAPDGLLIHSFAGNDWRTCRDHVLTLLGIKPSHRVPLRLVQRDVATRTPNELALQLWREAVNPEGTLAEQYLGLRGLRLPENATDVLRFHRSCPFGKGQRHPCMIALYRDIRMNEPKAIHRTALTSLGEKIDRKVLGPKAGCAIKLTPDENVTEGLTIAEGVETALAGAALDFRPTWALGDAGEMRRFAPLAGIESLTILVDHDAAGQAAAMECSRRWTSAGREVFRVVPAAQGADMADLIIKGRAA